ELLQAPVMAFRRGRGVLDGRSPFSVTLPVGHELWAEADAVLGIGTRMFQGIQHWGLDDRLTLIRIDADPLEPERFRPPAVALGVQDARRDTPVLALLGDGGFLFTATEMATAIHHRIPLVAVVFNDNAYGNVRRNQQERFGNRIIASDLSNPDFVRFAESFG